LRPVGAAVTTGVPARKAPTTPKNQLTASSKYVKQEGASSAGDASSPGDASMGMRESNESSVGHMSIDTNYADGFQPTDVAEEDEGMQDTLDWEEVVAGWGEKKKTLSL